MQEIFYDLISMAHQLPILLPWLVSLQDFCCRQASLLLHSLEPPISEAEPHLEPLQRDLVFEEQLLDACPGFFSIASLKVPYSKLAGSPLLDRFSF